MARPLRIDVKNGWYHVMARGIERRSIFPGDTYCMHFLDLLGEMSDHYGVGIHGYALMGNHYHLLIQTPHANASKALQWLNVSHSAWFNAKRKRVGHVFQGRFGSVLIQGEGSWLLEASIYLHLNPVRISALGLGKTANRTESMGLREPSPEEIKARLKQLRTYRWNSYRVYAGYCQGADWLQTNEILKRARGKAAYRKKVQSYVTRGIDPEGFESLQGKMAIGTTAFLEKTKSQISKLSKEYPGHKALSKVVGLDQVIKVVERQRGEHWEDFRDRYGDWGRDMVLYLARQRTGMSLRELGMEIGSLDYKTVGKAIERMDKRIDNTKELRLFAKKCLKEMSHVET